LNELNTYATNLLRQPIQGSVFTIQICLFWDIAPPVNLTACQIFEVSYNLASTPCARCQQPASRFTTAGRTAIDRDLDQPVLLYVTVSVHYCLDCDHCFRAQPPFLRRNAIYTNRVVEKAIQSVYEDGLSMCRVPDRLGRDFWASLMK
jgi:hypothetical protein